MSRSRTGGRPGWGSVVGSDRSGSSRPVIVVGAGPAGITAAAELARRGVPVSVYEAESSVGGLSRSFELWGRRVDLGPHRFFTSQPRIRGAWGSRLDGDVHRVERLTRIFFGGRFYHYPLKAGNALWNMGLPQATACVASYLREQVRSGDAADPHFEAWVVRRFGRRLFEMFFQGYSEKLWGLPCTELDVDFAAQRIRKFSLGEAVLGALGLGGRHKTLVDRFDYPAGGSGTPYERMADEVRVSGGSVQLGSPVARVVVEGNRVRGVELRGGAFVAGDTVVSTMPLTELVEGLEGVPERVRGASSALGYRNTLLVYLRIPAVRLFPDQWIYVHSPDLRFGRLTNFENWAGDGAVRRREDTVVALEYWCQDDDEDWGADDAALVRRAGDELVGTGLVADARPLEGQVVRLHRSYPVYRCGYQSHVAVIREHLDGVEGLVAVGRNGSFKYNNQDHSILMGLLAAENLAEGANHDLWRVNSDFDEYQEAATAEPGQ